MHRSPTCWNKISHSLVGVRIYQQEYIHARDLTLHHHPMTSQSCFMSSNQTWVNNFRRTVVQILLDNKCWMDPFFLHQFGAQVYWTKSGTPANPSALGNLSAFCLSKPLHDMHMNFLTFGSNNFSSPYFFFACSNELCTKPLWIIIPVIHSAELWIIVPDFFGFSVAQRCLWSPSRQGFAQNSKADIHQQRAHLIISLHKWKEHIPRNIILWLEPINFRKK